MAENKLEGLPSEMEDYVTALTIPDDCYLQWSGLLGLWLVRKDHSAHFRLTDRTFGDVDTTKPGVDTNDINYWVGDSISGTIDALLGQREVVRVLDVASGPRNKAAYDVAKRYGSRVVVTALDLCNYDDHCTAPNLTRVTADACAMPFEAGSFDFVYSFQFITYLPGDQRGGVIDEAMRVMGSQGQAVLEMIDNSFLENNVWMGTYFERPAFLPIAFKHLDEEVVVAFEPVRGFRSVPPGMFALNAPRGSPYVRLKKEKW